MDIFFSHPYIHDFDEFPNVGFVQRIIAAHNFFHGYGFKYGLNTIDGHLTNEPVSKALNIPFKPIDEFLA